MSDIQEIYDFKNKKQKTNKKKQKNTEPNVSYDEIGEQT